MNSSDAYRKLIQRKQPKVVDDKLQNIPEERKKSTKRRKKKKIHKNQFETEMKYNPNHELIMKQLKGNAYWSKGTGREDLMVELDGVMRA